MRVLLRGRGERETVLRARRVEVDLLERRAARTDGEEVVLTQREFEVLVYLLRHKNRAVTRDMLGREVWKEPDYHLTNVVDVYIPMRHHARKLERLQPESPRIRTLRGVGYSAAGPTGHAI